MKIYFAGPLFSEAERDWIRSTISKIESLAAQRGTKIEIIFPYDLITQKEIHSPEIAEIGLIGDPFTFDCEIGGFAGLEGVQEVSSGRSPQERAISRADRWVQVLPAP